MTLPAFATTDDLGDRIPNGIATADLSRAQAALDDASVLIREAAGKDWVTDDEEPGLVDDVPALLLTICCAAAKRAFLNPNGVTQEQETIGSFTELQAYKNSEVYLNAREQAMVKAAARGSATSGDAFTIDTAPCLGTEHSLLCSLNFGGTYCSCGADIAGYPLYELDA